MFDTSKLINKILTLKEEEWEIIEGDGGIVHFELPCLNIYFDRFTNIINRIEFFDFNILRDVSDEQKIQLAGHLNSIMEEKFNVGILYMLEDLEMEG